MQVQEIDRIIEMAWEDRTPFDAIKNQFSLSEHEVIALMRYQLRRSSFKLWRARVAGRKSKHSLLRIENINRFKSNAQRSITNNKISKSR